MSNNSQILFPVQMRPAFIGKDDKPSVSDFLFMEHYKNTSLQDISGEYWKPVVGYEDFYLVSNYLRVKRISGYVFEKTGKRLCKKPVKSNILSQRINDDGYWQVRLSMNNKRIAKRVHRLYAEAFLPNPDKKESINHKNLVKSDNRAENIEWCTVYENTKHALDNGAIPTGSSVYCSKLTEEDVVNIYKSALSSRKLAMMYGVSDRAICKIKKGISWKNITSTIK